MPDWIRTHTTLHEKAVTSPYLTNVVHCNGASQYIARAQMAQKRYGI